MVEEAVPWSRSAAHWWVSHMSLVAASRERNDRPARQSDSLKRADGTRPRVLLAEDSDPARTLMASLLERMGCRVDVASDGQEALACMRFGVYDAVLMDIEMPVLDGLSTALEIRQLGGPAAQTPIIALSALITDIASRPLLAAAFDAAITKPARRDDLYRALNAFIALGANAATDRPVAVAWAPCGALDYAQQERIFGGLGKPHRRALMSLAANELTQLVLELEAAALASAPDKARRIAHKIRGTAANFAAVALARLAAALENDCTGRLPDDIATRIDVINAAAGDAIVALRSPARSSQPSRPAKVRASG